MPQTAPKAGDAIQVASQPFGRETGAWYDATVVSVDAASGLVEVDVTLPDGVEGPGDTTHRAAIAGESDLWRRPAKASK